MTFDEARLHAQLAKIAEVQGRPVEEVAAEFAAFTSSTEDAPVGPTTVVLGD